jgi:hypothetical protein
MFQTYATATQRVSKCSFNNKRETVSFGKQPDVVEFHNSMGLTEDEVKRRRKALTEYIISGMDTDNIELDNIPPFKELLDKPTNEIIDSCGDDLAKINKLTGHYGLVKYAAFTPQKGMCTDIYETVADSFSDYLMHNYKGSVKALYKRYGECGEVMYNEYLDQGFLLQDTDKNHKNIYCTTPEFLNAYYGSNNLSHMK